jgi:queuine/archaeosine tRNA-ribosyltransferase
MENIRKAIEEDNFLEFREEFYKKYNSRGRWSYQPAKRSK